MKTCVSVSTIAIDRAMLSTHPSSLHDGVPALERRPGLTGYDRLIPHPVKRKTSACIRAIIRVHLRQKVDWREKREERDGWEERQKIF